MDILKRLDCFLCNISAINLDKRREILPKRLICVFYIIFLSVRLFLSRKLDSYSKSIVSNCSSKHTHIHNIYYKELRFSFSMLAIEITRMISCWMVSDFVRLGNTVGHKFQMECDASDCTRTRCDSISQRKCSNHVLIHLELISLHLVHKWHAGSSDGCDSELVCRWHTILCLWKCTVILIF